MRSLLVLGGLVALLALLAYTLLSE